MASADVALPPDLRKFENTNTSKVSLKGAPIEALPELPVPVPSVNGSVDVKSSIALPVIDLSGLASGDPAARKEIIKQVGNAASEFGFFQIVNHGFPEKKINKLFQQSRDFFDLPAEMKERVGKDPNDVTFGYQFKQSYEKMSTVIPWLEYLAQGHHPSPAVESVAEKIWPGGNPTFCNNIYEYAEAAGVVLRELLELLAEYLGLQPNFFSKNFVDNKEYRSSWRLHRYGACPEPSRTVGARWHADTGILTILWQNEVGGLQVKKDGEVIDVTPIPGAFVINVGDSMMAWSNGRFPSVDHQAVLNSEFDRFSMVYFFFAPMDFTISCPPELIDETHPALYIPFTGAQYRANAQKLIRNNKLSKITTMQTFLRDRPDEAE